MEKISKFFGEKVLPFFNEKVKPLFTNKKTLIPIAAGGAVLICVFIACYIGLIRPYNEATEAFESAVATVTSINNELETALEAAKTMLNNDKPLEEATATELSDAIAQAEDAKRIIPEKPSKTDEILVAAEELSKPLSYSEELTVLSEKTELFKTSVQRMNQVTAPTSEFIAERLKDVETVTGVAAVTEDNDPNGNLNKPGFYIAAVYFESSLVTDKYYKNNKNILDKGTSGGGQVEVYATAEEAQQRDEYLASFDGTILASGSHSVLGTCVIRVSDKLSASKKKRLETAIYNKLTEIIESPSTVE
ncbi:MAG: EbhA [Oscillospiraceae bacterium]|jgi:hypothetical protein|nr:EbhA [Oscillospiraceae bacterium]